MDKLTFIGKLDDILKERQNASPSESYTAKLLQEGIDRILRKIGEETGEVIIAAKNDDTTELQEEVADLLYHVCVLLRSKNLSLEDINAVLEQRHRA